MPAGNDWAPERYPVVFHSILEAGGGVLYPGDLPWTLASVRVRWYAFVRASGDLRKWTVKVHPSAIEIRARETRRGDEARKLLLRGLKTATGGIDKRG